VRRRLTIAYYYVCRARYCFRKSDRPSVRPFVCPMPVLCLKELTSRHVYWRSSRDIAVVFFGFWATPLLQKNPVVTPLAGTLNTRGVNIFYFRPKSPLISETETVQERPTVTYRKSSVADRSMSVPMTLSDLERRDANGSRFSGGSK